MIQAQGTPPERYQLEFQIKGLREVDEQLQTVANHIVEISLPLSYPRLPPQCRMLTPVFHPNIAPHAICIGDHWSAGEPLWSMVARIGEMIAYQSYNTKSPLNGEAARWVEEHLDQLPLDRTNFILDAPARKESYPHPPLQPPYRPWRRRMPPLGPDRMRRRPFRRPYRPPRSPGRHLPPQCVLPRQVSSLSATDAKRGIRSRPKRQESGYDARNARRSSKSRRKRPAPES